MICEPSCLRSSGAVARDRDRSAKIGDRSSLWQCDKLPFFKFVTDHAFPCGKSMLPDPLTAVASCS